MNAIRNSVVAKLWLTIIALFIVVLALLSMFLEQLFDSYFVRTEQERLEVRMQHMVSVMNNYSGNTAAAIIHELESVEQGKASIAERPEIEYMIAALSQDQLATMVKGLPVVHRGLTAPWNTQEKQEIESFFVLQPVIINGEIIALIKIIQPIAASEAVEKVRELLFFAAGLGILLATGLAFVVSRNLSNPLVVMNRVAEEMAQGNFHGKVQVATGDEVGRLGNTLNTLAYRLEENIDHLEREKEQLSSIITAMSDGVVSSDLVGNITLANPTARQMIRAQVMAEAGRLSDRELPEDLRNLMSTVMKNGQTLVDEVNWQGRVLVITMAPLYEKDGETLRGFVSVLHDITHQRTIEKMRKDFIANVSHELRTPLAMMQGYSEALLDEFGDDPEQRRELTHIILDETHRMRRLVNDLLDLAQLESGQFQMEEEEVDMIHLIRRVGRKFTTVSHERGVSLHVEVEEALQPLLVKGDSDRLEQVFTNLVDNAFRHTPKGGAIHLSLTRDGAFIHATVRDTGEGIPDEDLQYVWERFYKVDKARTRSKGGTGIGLAITRNIVKNHHGDILVESEVGRGTAFKVLLPSFVKEA